jgi:hypothetical protein
MRKKKILVAYMKKQEVCQKGLMDPVRIRGMSLAPFFENGDDLNATISMEENYQKLGGNLGQNNESALKD